MMCIFHRWRDIARESTETFMGEVIPRAEYTGVQRCIKCGDTREECFCMSGIIINKPCQAKIDVINKKLESGELFIVKKKGDKNED